MPNWKVLVSRIREAQTEINWLLPYRDAGLVPNPGASEAAIRRAELRVGRRLPPSYRAFLRYSDGWTRFFEGATLLGTSSLGRRTYTELARAACEAAETPVPQVGPPAPWSARSRLLVPFGIDLQATTLFAFNAAVVRSDGEYEVIAWINEIGVRRSSFEEFLEFVLELCVAELSDRVELAMQSA